MTIKRFDHLRLPLLTLCESIVLLLIMPWINALKAQTQDSSRFIIEDGYIEKMNDDFSIKLSMNSDYETFSVNTETNDIKLSPNVSNVATIGINYRYILLHVGYAPDFLPGNGDNDIKGETKALNLGVGLILRRLFTNIQYSKVKGYYLENTSDYMPWKKGDPYIQFPNLLYKGISLNAGWRFNPKVSLKSLIAQTERQLKSAGSFMPVINIRHYTIDDQSTANPGGATQKSDNLEWNLGFGYIYTFVLSEKFYASLSFVPSLGSIRTHLVTRFPTGDVKTKQDNLAFRWDTKGALGYNGRKFFGGLYVGLSGISNKQQNTTVINYGTRIFYEFFVGMRFRTPKTINSEVDKIEMEIGGHKN